MQPCRECGRPLAGGGSVARCRCATPRRRVRTDGGRRNGPGEDDGHQHDSEQKEDWKEGLQPPHWERQGESEPGDRHQHAEGQPEGAGQPAQGDHAGAERPPAGDEPDGEPPAAWHAGEGGRTLGRRELLVGGAGAAALAAGGWWAFLRGRDGPEAAVGAYLDAIDSGDYEALVDAVHEDGPMADSFNGHAEEFLERIGPISVDVDALEQFDEESDADEPAVQRFASVFAAYTITRDEPGEDDGPERSPGTDQITEIHRVALAASGDWGVWEREAL